jgi:hypothetical protein
MDRGLYQSRGSRGEDGGGGGWMENGGGGPYRHFTGISPLLMLIAHHSPCSQPTSKGLNTHS